MTTDNYPWPHTVIDNYYDPILLEAAVEEILKNIRSNRHDWVVKSGYHTFITAENIHDSQKLPATRKLLATRDPRVWLNNFPYRRDHDSLYIHSEAVVCLPGARHPIHDEAENKVLSLVTYLHPAENRGTLLYDTQKTLAKQVPWKPNRTLIFAGNSGVTWHSYEANDNVRVTLNTFLMR